MWVFVPQTWDLLFAIHLPLTEIKNVPGAKNTMLNTMTALKPNSAKVTNLD